MTPDEVRRMKRSDCLVMISGEAPVRDRKYVDYYARLTNNFNFMTVLLLGKAVIPFIRKKVKP